MTIQTAMLFESVQECVTQERVGRAGERIPGRGRDFAQIGNDFEAQNGGAQDFGSGWLVKTGNGMILSPRPPASVILLRPVFSTSSIRTTACIGM